ncbi:SDR family oxidoreductase [Gluconobacter roseus]|uniref:Dehydrogenase n=1 Tax=Gluconobacter roseus NBRC 3990 TaxID=1307950 RepID=A0A4Y3M496_9PROT|nr:SDR family oxidoreductase [Gluconobacter roseus]KXV42643.1 oxidoreductase [Gluconobacter roseus]GBR49578.1 oxidoreductase [Gluconobacter roseus NBRC 3990]GEB04070.1 dehydrogenase [Gluconobacter roseus NBRC 3990]GLP92515.1 dehydrogenase [Gluconobacter roseus NBRC 3990]
MTQTAAPAWSTDSLERLDGKTALITGSTGGLGFEVACGLAKQGAAILLSGRNHDKGQAALARLHERVPFVKARFELLDLASLAGIEAFASAMRSRGEPIHLLANNAGVMGPATRLTTKDGFELQFGTNHLGHFALTGRLLPLLAAGNATVMTVASLAALKGEIPFGDLNARHSYNPMVRYRQSKLCNLLFALELNRRALKAPWPIHSRAAHPGWAASDIVANNGSLDQSANKAARFMRGLARRVAGPVFHAMGQTVEEGAWPLLYALASPEARDGGYYGPQGPGERRGVPGIAGLPALAHVPELAERLWTVSEQMTGVKYGLL